MSETIGYVTPEANSDSQPFVWFSYRHRTVDVEDHLFVEQEIDLFPTDGIQFFAELDVESIILRHRLEHPDKRLVLSDQAMKVSGLWWLTKRYQMTRIKLDGFQNPFICAELIFS